MQQKILMRQMMPIISRQCAGLSSVEYGDATQCTESALMDLRLGVRVVISRNHKSQCRPLFFTIRYSQTGSCSSAYAIMQRSTPL